MSWSLYVIFVIPQVHLHSSDGDHCAESARFCEGVKSSLSMTVEKTPLGDILACATLHATCYTINREICPKHQSAPITFWRKQRYNRNVAGDTKRQLCGDCGDICHPGWRMITFCFNYYTHQWALMDAPLKSHYNTLLNLTCLLSEVASIHYVDCIIPLLSYWIEWVKSRWVIIHILRLLSELRDSAGGSTTDWHAKYG